MRLLQACEAGWCGCLRRAAITYIEGLQLVVMAWTVQALHAASG